MKESLGCGAVCHNLRYGTSSTSLQCICFIVVSVKRWGLFPKLPTLNRVGAGILYMDRDSSYEPEGLFAGLPLYKSKCKLCFWNKGAKTGRGCDKWSIVIWHLNFGYWNRVDYRRPYKCEKPLRICPQRLSLLGLDGFTSMVRKVIPYLSDSPYR